MDTPKRNRIYGANSASLNEEDRRTLCLILIKAGYCARLGKEKAVNGKTVTFVEYWMEGDR